MVENTKTAKFELVQRFEPLILEGNSYFFSHQKITSDTGNTSEHMVLRKVPTSNDGSPRGQSRPIFLPIRDWAKLLEHASKITTQ